MTRTRPCTLYRGCLRPVYTAVHGRLYGLCKRPCTAVNVPGTQPCAGHVPCAVYTAVYRPVHGRVQTVYTAVHGLCIWSVYDPNTAVYPVPGLFTARLHSCSRRLRTRYTAVHDPNTAMYTAVYRAHGCLYGLCTRPCTGHVPCTRACLRLRPTNVALLRPVYTAVHRPCTRPFTGRVHGPFMTRTRPCTLYPGCLRPVYAAVHGGYEPGTRPYMIRVPCTRSSTACVHGRVRP